MSEIVHLLVLSKKGVIVKEKRVRGHMVVFGMVKVLGSFFKITFDVGVFLV